MSKRGLSREEKRTKMLELFHESSEFFTLKELEKNAPKHKGIVQQSVKEILDELVDDGLVTADKIGTSNYYWSFPSAAGSKKQAELDRYTKEATALADKIKDARGMLATVSAGREDTPDRRSLLSTLDGVRAQTAAFTAELAAYGAADPVKYQRKREATVVAKSAAQRWHENVDAVVGFIKAQQPLEDETAFRYGFGMGDDWDEIDFA